MRESLEDTERFLPPSLSSGDITVPGLLPIPTFARLWHLALPKILSSSINRISHCDCIYLFALLVTDIDELFDLVRTTTERPSLPPTPTRQAIPVLGVFSRLPRSSSVSFSAEQGRHTTCSFIFQHESCKQTRGSTLRHQYRNSYILTSSINKAWRP